MNYEKNYYDYIAYVKTLNRTHENFIGEGHHVIPKSFGGTGGSKDWEHPNIIPLNYREHFLAHYLLVKMYENKNEFYYQKMLHAFNRTCGKGNKRGSIKDVNSYLYEKIKIKRSEFTKKSYEERFGKEKAEEIKKKMSEQRKGICFYKKNKTKEELKIIEEKRLRTRKNNNYIPYNKGKKLDEIFLKETVEKIKEQCGNSMRGKTSDKKGKSLEQLYGEEKGKKLRTFLRENSVLSKKIQCIETGEIFISYSEAERKTKISRGSIAISIKKNKTIKNLTFKLLDC
jgi:hypothetical protein